MQRHTHNGIDSEQLLITDIRTTKSVLTASNTSAAISVDSAIIDNLRTRLNELETGLKINNLLS